MKLYRGLKSSEYKEFNKEALTRFNSNWEKILKLREKGDLTYPKELNKIIIGLFKHQYLVRQFFTDDKDLAERYAKKEKGLLLEIEVSVKDVLKYFILEFQNYSKRRTKFEITYIIKGLDLFNNSKKWKLRVLE